MIFFLSLLTLVTTVFGWDGWSTDDSDLVMGMNVGSYFIPEPWMMEQFIDCYANGSTDTWALQSLPAAQVENIMIMHLENFVREVDFADAQSRGVNFVRIPVAFWMFIPTEGDEPYWTDSRQKDVYLLQLVQWAQKYGMEVLIDIHALPGAQNTDEHSGRNLVNAGLSPEFFNSTNLARGNDTIDAIISWIQGLDDSLNSTIAMIELANEPDISAAESYEALVGYYLASQSKIATSLPNVWTVIGDAWLGTTSWGTVFTPDQKVAMDLHWWNMFGTPPTLSFLQSYCNLTNATSSATSWKNPILVGEFAANQNNNSLIAFMTDIEKLSFYQTYYATQLWAARGSGGATPLYRGAFLWNMVCTNCGDVWEPYYIAGGSDTLVITAPSWCDSGEAAQANLLSINSSPVRAANSCGLYLDSSGGTGTATASGGTASATQKGGASRLRPLTLPVVVFMVLVAIWIAV